MKELNEFAEAQKLEFPHLRAEIDNLVSICRNSITEEEGSAEHEISLCMSAITNLISGEDE